MDGGPLGPLLCYIPGPQCPDSDWPTGLCFLSLELFRPSLSFANVSLSCRVPRTRALVGTQLPAPRPTSATSGGATDQAQLDTASRGGGPGSCVRRQRGAGSVSTRLCLQARATPAGPLCLPRPTGDCEFTSEGPGNGPRGRNLKAAPMEAFPLKNAVLKVCAVSCSRQET